MRGESSADIQPQAPFNLGSLPEGDDVAIIIIACLPTLLERPKRSTISC